MEGEWKFQIMRCGVQALERCVQITEVVAALQFPFFFLVNNYSFLEFSFSVKRENSSRLLTQKKKRAEILKGAVRWNVVSELGHKIQISRHFKVRGET